MNPPDLSTCTDGELEAIAQHHPDLDVRTQARDELAARAEDDKEGDQ